MDICFRDEQHREFYLGCIEQANCNGVPVDVYFKSFVYLCGLCPEIRQHFSDLFDWSPASRGIRLDSLEKDDIFCCGYQEYFFEALRLRFPEYSQCRRDGASDKQAIPEK